MQHARRWDGHLGRGACDVFPQEAEVFEHRMPAEPDLAYDPHAFGLRRDTFERDALFRRDRIPTPRPSPRRVPPWAAAATFSRGPPVRVTCPRHPPAA